MLVSSPGTPQSSPGPEHVCPGSCTILALRSIHTDLQSVSYLITQTDAALTVIVMSIAVSCFLHCFALVRHLPIPSLLSFRHYVTVHALSSLNDILCVSLLPYATRVYSLIFGRLALRLMYGQSIVDDPPYFVCSPRCSVCICFINCYMTSRSHSAVVSSLSPCCILHASTFPSTSHVMLLR